MRVHYNLRQLPLFALILALLPLAPAVAQKLPDTTAEVRGLLAKARATNPKREKDGWDEVFKLLDEILKRAQELKDLRGEAEIRLYLGDTRYETGSREALPIYEQALSFCRKIDYRLGEAEALVGLGRIYSDRRDEGKTREHYLKAIDIYRSLGDRRTEAILLSGIGSHYILLDMPEEALKYFNDSQAIVISLPEKDQLGESVILSNIGRAYSALGEKQKALTFYLDALRMDPDVALGNPYAAAPTKNSIGLLYQELGDYKKALEYYMQALPAFQEVGDKQREGKVMQNIGYVYTKLNNNIKALYYYHEALRLLGYSEDKLGEAEVYSKLSHLYFNKNEIDLSLGYAEKSIYLMEKISNSILSGNMKMRFMESKSDIYRFLGYIYSLKKDPAKAFAHLQHSKARGLLNTLNYSGQTLEMLLTSLERERLAALKDEVDEINQARTRVAATNAIGGTQQFNILSKQLVDAERKLSIYRDELSARYPQFAVRDVHPIAAETIVEKLPTNAALLEFQLTTKGRLSLLVLTRAANGKSELSLFRLQEPDERTITTLRNAIGTRTKEGKLSGSWQTAARKLYSKLLAPAEALLKNKNTLILCPDGNLWDVPFATLLNGRDQTLLERFTLEYAPSASVRHGAQVLSEAQKNKPRNDTVYIAANPAFDEGTRFAPSAPGERPMVGPDRPITGPDRNRIVALPGAEREAKAIEALWPDALVQRGKAASEENVLANIGKFRYVSVATHGFTNETVPMQSFLVLADPAGSPKKGDDFKDGYLTARELVQLDLSSVELAVLSACNTGRGENKKGEGIVGFTWALFAAGCPTQIVSQWGVNDESTGELMAHFYKDLKAGKPKAESLRAAALALKNDGKHSHPYYWAPFILVGDGR